MTRILPILALLCLIVALPANANQSARFSGALSSMRNGEWEQAAVRAQQIGPVASDIVEWHRLRAGRGTYDEIIAFLERRPDWPGLKWLRRKSEPEIARQSPERILDFYSEAPPQTAEGILSYAEALLTKDRPGEAEASLVVSWRTLPMGRSTHDRYLARHGALLAPHHEARLDRMLWDRHLSNARRMMALVDDAHKALAEARIALHEQAPGVDNRIAAVPADLRNDPGLAYDRFVWRARKGRDEDAISLLLERSVSAAALGEPAEWASRRRAFVRSKMRSGDPRRAYQMASQHHLTEGSSFADLEWLSGYIALQKLNDPASALKHFQAFDESVRSPISKGRAGYWLGRAQEALGNEEAAQAAYKAGARFQTSFYGLLAAEKAGVPFDPSLVGAPETGPWQEADFMTSSVIEAGLLFLAAGEPALAERFLTHLVESLDPVSINQVGAMALELNRPHLAVMIGKRAAKRGIVAPAAYYAVHPVAQISLPMAPEMTLAIARRESEFDPVVVSGAGARGLMQVMPSTARAVARDMGVLANHSADRLLNDWEYNAQLGATYLAGLARTFNGNAVMMSAGYNAGPGRPRRWIKTFGDPRTGTIDIVDWIEHIPFRETRNYVMRVTESLPVYRARLGMDPLPIPFSRELAGSTLRAFAP